MQPVWLKYLPMISQCQVNLTWMSTAKPQICYYCMVASSISLIKYARRIQQSGIHIGLSAKVTNNQYRGLKSYSLLAAEGHMVNFPISISSEEFHINIFPVIKHLSLQSFWLCLVWCCYDMISFLTILIIDVMLLPHKYEMYGIFCKVQDLPDFGNMLYAV